MVGKRTSLFVTATTALAALSLGASTAAAADPPGGRVLLESRTGSISQSKWDWNIYSARPDGSDLRPIHSSSAMELHPRFSPDGSKIVYERAPVYYRDGVDLKGSTAIYVSNADGTAVEPLVQVEGVTVSNPDWSPDGSRVVFDLISDGTSSSAIYSVPLNGEFPTLLTSGAGNRYDAYPVWSPDSKRVAFTRHAPPYGVSTIPVGLQGAGERQITSHMDHAREAQLSWSRANGQLAYSDSPSIYAGRDSDGSGFEPIVISPVALNRPVWTPDGRGVGYSTNPGPRWQSVGSAESVMALLQRLPELDRAKYELADWVADPPASTAPQAPGSDVQPNTTSPAQSAAVTQVATSKAQTVRCTAPRLTKQSLKQAKRRARKAKCPVKIVRKRIRGKKFGIVTSQSPKANSKIFNGQKLKLVVAKR